MLVKVFNSNSDKLPDYATPGSMGADIRYTNKGDIVEIKPGERKVLVTGLYVAFPFDYIISIRPKSGLAAKKGITVLNTPGTIDADYPGVIGVCLINLGNESQKIIPGNEIAQVLAEGPNGLERIIWEEVDSLDELFEHREQLRTEWLNNHPDSEFAEKFRKAGWGSTY